MNMIKTSIVALAGLAAVAASQAATIKISGSTALRSATVNAIKALGYTRASGSSDTASNTTWTKAGADTLACSWSGSIAGVQDVISNVSDIALSDSLPTSSLLAGSGSVQNIPVGIVPFFWVKGKSADLTVQTALDNITNIDNLKAQAALNGFVPASFLTKDEADAGIAIVVMGRDSGSGTRLGAFNESGFGFGNIPTQYNPTVSGSTITALTSTSSGASSGGTLAGNLARTTVASCPIDGNATDVGVIGYCGAADVKAAGLLNQVLAWNGTAIPTAASGLPDGGGVFDFANIRNGSYTFWTTGQLVYKNTNAFAAFAATLAAAVETEVEGTSPAGVGLSTMNVSRSIEGGVIGHN